jgi:hypothetical protein
MRHIAADFDIGHADRRQPMLTHSLVHQLSDVATELGGNTIGAGEAAFH